MRDDTIVIWDWYLKLKLKNWTLLPRITTYEGGFIFEFGPLVIQRMRG